MTIIIDGTAIAEKIKSQVSAEIKKLKAEPHFVVIQVGENPASSVYVKNKLIACQKVGIKTHCLNLKEDVEENKIHDLIEEINESDSYHGLLIQLPLPPHIPNEPIIESINPIKDVDGFHPLNVGRMTIRTHQPYLHPCTAWGIVHMLDTVYPKDGNTSGMQGKKVVVIGQSMIVGRPLAIMLQNDGATVTMCDEHTIDLSREVQGADVIVSATGVPGLINKKLIESVGKPNITIIDAGIAKINGTLVGDADPEIRDMVGAISPVPKGVGPVTIAFLTRNILKAYCIQKNLPIIRIK